jgi:hypothetical protein
VAAGPDDAAILVLAAVEEPVLQPRAFAHPHDAPVDRGPAVTIEPRHGRRRRRDRGQREALARVVDDDGRVRGEGGGERGGGKHAPRIIHRPPAFLTARSTPMSRSERIALTTRHPRPPAYTCAW